MITVRYFGGAAEAAGATQEQVEPAANVSGLVTTLVARHADLEPVLNISSFLVDEQSGDQSTPLHESSVVDVLPPFAGG